jgi:hypothetical protein
MKKTFRWRRDRHAGRGGFPHESNLRRGQGVGFVDEVAKVALSGLGFSRAGGGDGACVIVAQGVEAGGGQRLLLGTDALYFAGPGVGVQFGQGEKLVAGLFNLKTGVGGGITSPCG